MIVAQFLESSPRGYVSGPRLQSGVIRFRRVFLARSYRKLDRVPRERRDLRNCALDESLIRCRPRG